MVSGITVNFKSANLLKLSVQAISRHVDEIVIVNHSQEEHGTLEKLASPKIKIYTRPNYGYASGCNFGATKAKGEFYIFFNPDTIVMDNTVSLLIDDLKQGYDIAVPKFLNPDLTFQPSTRQFPKLKHLLVSRSSLLRILFKDTKLENEYFGRDLEKVDTPLELKDRFPLGGFFAIKRTTFARLGGFDERFFLYFEDTDFFKRALLNGFSIIYDPRAQIIHYHGYSQRTTPLKSNFYKIKSYYLYVCKHDKNAFLRIILAFTVVFYLTTTHFLDLGDMYIREKRWCRTK